MPRSGDQELEPIELDRRLSQSMLWRIQRGYFDRVGIEAWRGGEVPHYITNNPRLAGAYAEVFLGFFRDLRTVSDEPLTIIELGAGSGRFGFLFLRIFSELVARSPLAGARFRYVMTDFTETSLAGWCRHPSLRPFVEQGVLDFGVFDVTSDRAIRLRIADEVLEVGARRALGVIANYVFDGIPQDAFWFEGGALYEHLVTLTPACRDPGEPLRPSAIDVRWTRRPAALDYYGDPSLDSILRGYASSVERATVLFPSAAIACLGRLAALAPAGLLVVSGDRGSMLPIARTVGGGPDIARHGSVSFEVNYHALAEYVRGVQGSVLAPEQSGPSFTITGFLLGAHGGGWAETRLSFVERIGAVGPVDFFVLEKALRGSYQQFDLASLLSLIRLSGWDPTIVYACRAALQQHREGASSEEVGEVVRTLIRAWDRYYPIGEQEDVALAFGLLALAWGADTTCTTRVGHDRLVAQTPAASAPQVSATVDAVRQTRAERGFDWFDSPACRIRTRCGS